MVVDINNCCQCSSITQRHHLQQKTLPVFCCSWSIQITFLALSLFEGMQIWMQMYAHAYSDLVIVFDQLTVKPLCHHNATGITMGRHANECQHPHCSKYDCHQMRRCWLAKFMMVTSHPSLIMVYQCDLLIVQTVPFCSNQKVVNWNYASTQIDCWGWP